MRIVELRAENVKRLHAVHIKPDGNVIQITGKNGNGKSSVLDSIAYALGGEKLCPAQPIRRGASSASVTVDLGDMVVERRWTASGNTYLTVTGKNGAKMASPQAILDRLVGKLTFDPLAFTRMKPAEQMATLKAVAGLDFTELDGKAAATYDERTLVNRELKQLEGQLAGLPAVEAPDAEVSVAELSKRLEAAHAEKRANDGQRRTAEEVTLSMSSLVEEHKSKRATLDERIGSTDQEIDRLQRQIEAIQQQIRSQEAIRVKLGEDWSKYDDAFKDRLLEATTKSEALMTAASKLVDPDTASITQQMADAEKVNANVRAKQARAKVAAALTTKAKESEALTRKLAGIEETKAEMLREAQMPVDGLGFSATGVTLNGLPFEQASSAEQIRVSVAMGIAFNKELRIVRIADGEKLDSDSMKLLEELAEQHDLQVWLERATDGEPIGVVIEDGYVRGAEVPEEMATS